MKELVLILLILAVFILGYILMTKSSLFIEGKSRLIPVPQNRRRRVRIAAENPLLLESVTSALEGAPRISILPSRGKAEQLMEQLMDEELDLVLLTEQQSQLINDNCTSLLIPYEKKIAHLPDGISENAPQIRVVWKKDTVYLNRDRVIFALEKKYCRLNTGYADYLS